MSYIFDIFFQIPAFVYLALNFLELIVFWRDYRGDSEARPSNRINYLPVKGLL